MMYQVNENIAYSSAGVCHIQEITQREIGGVLMDYYVLKPLFDSRSTVYVPLNNDRLLARMRPVLNPDEASALMESLTYLDTCWIENDNLRKEEYRSRITDGLPDDLAAIFKTLILRRKELEANSRKLRSADEGFLKECEKLLSYEVSYAQGSNHTDISQQLYAIVLNN